MSLAAHMFSFHLAIYLDTQLLDYHCLWWCSLAAPVMGPWVYGFVVLCPGTPEAQPAVVLV